MKKITYLLTVLILQACSSIHDIPYKDKARGNYLFNQKLKAGYTKFFVENVFKNGSYVYAGPTFLKFNNFQMIKLDQLGSTSSHSTIYTEDDGTKHEFIDHTPLKPFYGEKSGEDRRNFLLEFSGLFKSFQQTVKDNLNVVVSIQCKKEVKCHLIPDIDFALFKDPYDFTFRLEEEDKIIGEKAELADFTDYEATAISNRMIYIGMPQKAAELAIGKAPFSQGISYQDVKFENGKVSHFKFGNYNYDLHYFISR